MRKVDQFTNMYSVTKTLKFKLIPQGKTEHYFNERKLLENDKKRTKDYERVKELIDDQHRHFINEALSDIKLLNLQDYAFYYLKSNRNKDDNKMMDDLTKLLRKEISSKFQEDKFKKEYENLFSKDIIEKTLPKVVSEEDLDAVKSFNKFATYFHNYHEIRKIMYKDEGKSSEIAYRLIDQNLPKYLDNVKSFNKVIGITGKDYFNEIGSILEEKLHANIFDICNVDGFNAVLTQKGIDEYNQLIGGYTNENGEKIKGINETINLYCQQKKIKLPILKPLFKQILSDRDSVSFIPTNFENDTELLKSIKEFYCITHENGKSLESELDDINAVFSTLNDYDLNGIYISNGKFISDLSKGLFNDWSVVQGLLNDWYDKEHTFSNPEKQEKERKKYFNKIRFYSLGYLKKILACSDKCSSSLEAYISESVEKRISLIKSNYEKIKDLLNSKLNNNDKLQNSTEKVEQIKAFLDTILDLQRFIKAFIGTGKEENKDERFYGNILEYYYDLDGIIPLYNRTRNFLTKKSYSEEKIKLNFEKSDFLTGWAQPDEWMKQEAHLFEKNGKYYIFITSRSLKADEWSLPLSSTINYDAANILEYNFQKPDNKNTPRMFIRSKGDSFAPAVREYDLPIKDILDIYDNGYYKTEYRKKNEKLYYESLKKMIDYYKIGFSRHKDYSKFVFNWKPSSEYENINEFFNDTICSCYYIKKREVNFNGLINMVNNGEGYLYEIYSKDFSEYSKGTPNLHTLYFKMLFDERNQNNVCFKLNGKAEMFYREASIDKKDAIVHPKNHAIKNKNPLNEKRESQFEYDLIKDKRYTERQYMLHLPITINYNAKGIESLNNHVRESIKASQENYVIGIDRGERNLIYICVVDSFGNIKEQKSFNIIENKVGKNITKTNYHALLDSREKDNIKAREEWKSIEGIKNIKEGYISQVVHFICELMIKYDAIIAMEDLNSGFKTSRVKVEKQVYQKFEKMLIDKLNFYASKVKAIDEIGGILSGYQLTNKFESFKKMQGQNGFIFYVPAWLTSKIDPTTGFANLLNCKYKDVKTSKEFIKRFDKIIYNFAENIFEFELDYNKFDYEFGTGYLDYKKKWTICSYGKRIYTFRNPEANNQYDSKNVDITKEFKELFNSYNIELNNVNMCEQICLIDDREFYIRFMKNLSLMLQMRNSMTGTEIDYLISPVRNDNNEFYNSNSYTDILNAEYPKDADANGAYHIAKKALWAIEQIKTCDDVKEAKLAISKKEWLEYVQNN